MGESHDGRRTLSFELGANKVGRERSSLVEGKSGKLTTGVRTEVNTLHDKQSQKTRIENMKVSGKGISA